MQSKIPESARLTDEEIENIPPPTSEEVLEFVDKNYGGNRKEINRIAAITALWQIKTANAQFDKINKVAIPIITKQQQAKDTAYYAEMMKKAIAKVREKAYKQAQEDERKRMVEWLEFNAPEYVWQSFRDGKDIR